MLVSTATFTWSLQNTDLFGLNEKMAFSAKLLQQKCNFGIITKTPMIQKYATLPSPHY